MKRIVTETVCDICGQATTNANMAWVTFGDTKALCPACAEKIRRKANGENFKTETDPAKMTNKELANALREDAEWAHANEWETPITLADDLEEAADRIEKGGLKWIDCKDRMPKDRQIVVFSTGYGIPQTGWRVGQSWFESWTSSKIYSKPTHWMAINEPYKENEEREG